MGSTLRVRGRKFPALINCTCIDWFHEWPQEALISVSMRFLNELEIIPEAIKPSVAQFMSYVHGSVNEMSKVYLMNERRHNYTTPKSFLELINLYLKILQGNACFLRLNLYADLCTTGPGQNSHLYFNLPSYYAVPTGVGLQLPRIFW